MTNMPINHIDERCVALRLNVKAIRLVLRDLERACPIRIRTILTDNGKEFTDRLFGLRKRPATGKHEFDLL